MARIACSTCSGTGEMAIFSSIPSTLLCAQILQRQSFPVTSISMKRPLWRCSSRGGGKQKGLADKAPIFPEPELPHYG